MSAEYNSYIVAHVDNVKKAQMWLKEHGIIEADILDQLSQHDLSKYTAEEYKAYDDYFYGNKTKAVQEAFDSIPKKEAEKTGEDCPNCGNPLVIRKGRYGAFVACSNFPECKY